MISSLLFTIERAWRYVRLHPQIQLALILVFVLPVAFLYTSNAFLEAGRANQDKLQRDRIGLLHDSFAALLQVSTDNIEVVQEQITYLTDLNSDITKFRIVRQDQQDFLVLAALDEEKINSIEVDNALYQTAAVRFDESLIFPFQHEGVRFWQSVRSISIPGGTYFILTETSFAAVDQYLNYQEQRAYYTLILVYVLVLVIAYWHIRTTDYKHLYVEAQNAIATKDLFTNMIAHELRAPLTSVKGYASMVLESPDHAKAEHYLNQIQLSTDRLLVIVNDLLDVARIQSGNLSMDIKVIPAQEIIRSVLSELDSMAVAKNLTLQTEGDQLLKLSVDPKRFHQVLVNIVSNAIKYTNEGVVTISTEETARAVEVRIKDTGMGITATDQKKLFAPFYRVGSDDVSTITGTGLGMWIARQFVEMMNGSIAVESIKDVGTHVVILIPKSN